MSTHTATPARPAIDVLVGPHQLSGILATPDNSRGVVVFAHGSGSSRLSSRNQYVAGFLQDAGVDLVIIPGATHLFPEPGALEQVARLAREWFINHL